MLEDELLELLLELELPEDASLAEDASLILAEDACAEVVDASSVAEDACLAEEVLFRPVMAFSIASRSRNDRGAFPGGDGVRPAA